VRRSNKASKSGRSYYPFPIIAVYGANEVYIYFIGGGEMMLRKRRCCFVLALACSFLVNGCASVAEVKSELMGTAKPAGGINESVPVTRSFSASRDKIWNSAQVILDEWGYVYEANTASNTIKTEPKYLNDTSSFRFIASDYAAKLYITVKGSDVTFRARFNKKSNIVLETNNAEFPEKENELRKAFFDALSKKLGT
jgi:hypothetical protein